MIVEVKKFHGEPDDLDKLKLEKFTDSKETAYQYQIGVSVIVKTNRDRSETFKVEFPTLTWFVDGEECEL